MKLSTDRILTTHAGSLPRPAALSALLALDEAGKPVDREELAAAIDRSMLDVIRSSTTPASISQATANIRASAI
jgi:5-methyltetrahydropteroyltriglutamate--homocysteine methyltransferase